MKQPIIFITTLLLVSCGNKLETPADAQFSYLQQNLISTQNGIALAPDHSILYVSLPVEERDYRDRPRVKIFTRQWQDSIFLEPKLISFAGAWSDYHPVLSPDGQRMYFNSTRPIPGQTDENRQVHLWYAERQGEGWGEAQYLSNLNVTGYHSSYPSIAADGSLYFNSDRPGGQGSMDIWFAKLENGAFQAPQLVPALNTEFAENDLCIDPQGRFLILNRYIPETGAIDLWISFKEDENWATPVLLKSVNRADAWELTPYISPDGRHFLCEINGQIHIWQLAEIIPNL